MPMKSFDDLLRNFDRLINGLSGQPPEELYETLIARCPTDGLQLRENFGSEASACFTQSHLSDYRSILLRASFVWFIFRDIKGRCDRLTHQRFQVNIFSSVSVTLFRVLEMA